MKPHPDDPRLSSYLLGELPPDEAAEIERAVAADPALRVTLDDLAATQRLIGDTLAGEQERLHDWQREVVRRAARDAVLSDKVVDLASGRRSVRPLLVLAAAAVVVIGAVWLMWRFPMIGPDSPVVNQPAAPDWGDPKVEIAVLPMPGPAEGRAAPEGAPAGAGFTELAGAQQAALRDDPERFLERIGETLRDAPIPPDSRLPSIAERQPVRASDTPVQPLPMIAGELSYHWLRSAVLDHRRLPPVKAVRVGELVNAFAYRLADPVEVLDVRVAAECGVCPWDDSAWLVLATVEGAGDGPRRVAAAFEADSGTISRYRLLGFGGAVVSQQQGDQALAMIPAAHRLNVMLQVWPTGSDGESPGALRGQVAQGAEVRPWLLPVPVAAPWESCSPEFRHAALIAGTGLWLSESEVGSRPRPEQLGALAAVENAATGQSGEKRAEGLRVVMRAVEIAAE